MSGKNKIVNGMKMCAGCETVRPVSDFVPKGDGCVTRLCKVCHSKYRKEKYWETHTPKRNFVIDGKKKCCRCGLIKPVSDYYKKPNGWIHHICRPCATIYKREHPVKDVRRTNLQNIHHITIEHYNDMLLKQDGRCAICGSIPMLKNNRGGTKSLSVDHDHVTGKNRGLLCNNCNAGLGFFHDNVEVLAKAISYLVKHSNKD